MINALSASALSLAGSGWMEMGPGPDLCPIMPAWILPVSHNSQLLCSCAQCNRPEIVELSSQFLFTIGAGTNRPFQMRWYASLWRLALALGKWPRVLNSPCDYLTCVRTVFCYLPSNPWYTLLCHYSIAYIIHSTCHCNQDCKSTTCLSCASGGSVILTARR